MGVGKFLLDFLFSSAAEPSGDRPIYKPELRGIKLSDGQQQLYRSMNITMTDTENPTAQFAFQSPTEQSQIESMFQQMGLKSHEYAFGRSVAVAGGYGVVRGLDALFKVHRSFGDVGVKNGLNIAAEKYFESQSQATRESAPSSRL